MVNNVVVYGVGVGVPALAWWEDRRSRDSNTARGQDFRLLPRDEKGYLVSAQNVRMVLRNRAMTRPSVSVAFAHGRFSIRVRAPAEPRLSGRVALRPPPSPAHRPRAGPRHHCMRSTRTRDSESAGRGTTLTHWAGIESA